MQKVNLESQILVYDSINELPDEAQNIMHKAIEMLGHAYAPYSNFHVGSAALTTTGNVYVGCNQENASYPLCMCGERVALYNAGANEPTVPITHIAIVCENKKKRIEGPVSPCGACRQVLSEFELRNNHPIKIYLKGDADKIYAVDSVKHLLPMGFDSTLL